MCLRYAKESNRADITMKGFFSLAQANFKSPNRRRYGQDFFDERMKATKRCQFETNGGDVSFSVQYQAGDEIQSTTNDDMSASSLANREPAQQPSPPASPEPDETSMDVKTPSEPVNDSNEKVQHGETQVKSPADPIRWFGILVPRELRSTQTSFSAAIDVTLAKAVNAAREMREIDTEIRKLRKTLRKIEKKTAVE